MSATRELIAALKSRFEASDPMPPAPPVPLIPSPPHRVFPTPSTRSRFASLAAAHTTALVGIGHVGTRYATDVVLQFQAELAVAHQAVQAVLPEGWAAQNGLLPLKSRVGDHRQFLLRPDLGRRLDEASLNLLRAQAKRGVDVQPILADGLSAVACMGSGVELLRHFTTACEARGMTVGTPMCARFARVWLEDEIGETVGARVAAILLGERPGLGTGDGLSAYLVHGPKIGKTDGDRNMMSNIHARGTPPAEAGPRLAILASAMLAQGTSGVSLDLSGQSREIGDAADRGYRAPQQRVRLVEVRR
jgi:ethanolamine ammonia-lyase small subunit